MNLLIETFFVVLSLGLAYCGDCPKPDAIVPCVCANLTISCITNNDFELDSVMKTIANNNRNESQNLNFQTFILNSSKIDKLDDSVFQGLTFETIKLLDCSKLACVLPSAFAGLETDIIEFRAEGTSFGNSDKGCNVFDAVKNFVNLKSITITGSDITEIPEKAFQGISPQTNLTSIDFNGGQGGQGGKIEKVGKYAFSTLQGLQTIDLSSNKISSIGSFGFAFTDPSTQTLLINLEHNDLNPQSFGVESFQVNERVCKLKLGANMRLQVLLENVFEPFLVNKINDSENNIIDLTGTLLVCTPENLWLLENEVSLKLRSKLQNILATDGQEFWKHTKNECKNAGSSTITASDSTTIGSEGTTATASTTIGSEETTATASTTIGSEETTATASTTIGSEETTATASTTIGSEGTTVTTTTNTP